MGSERLSSDSALGWRSLRCGACLIVERHIPLAPAGGRGCWGAHPRRIARNRALRTSVFLFLLVLFLLCGGAILAILHGDR